MPFIVGRRRRRNNGGPLTPSMSQTHRRHAEIAFVRLLRGVATAAPQPWELAGQLGRNLVEVLVMAVLLSRFQIRARREAVGFGLLVVFILSTWRPATS
ncbi:hypothetical protein [Nonomuraea sp. NPDC005650]|uniref:hypothetical protein n=1 Tax=Nonomuraea sp. NPDC005650 TaxID=3157045 RepID=UPI0033B64FA8